MENSEAEHRYHWIDASIQLEKFLLSGNLVLIAGLLLAYRWYDGVFGVRLFAILSFLCLCYSTICRAHTIESMFRLKKLLARVKAFGGGMSPKSQISSLELFDINKSHPLDRYFDKFFSKFFGDPLNKYSYFDMNWKDFENKIAGSTDRASLFQAFGAVFWFIFVICSMFGGVDLSFGPKSIQSID